jgi:outer membrane protein TolC
MRGTGSGAVLPCALAAGLLACAGCGSAWRTLSRPEGDGGWDPQRRVETVESVGRSAGVAVDGRSTTPGEQDGAAPRKGFAPAAASRAIPAEARDRPPAALDLTTALAMAARGNRRITAADKEVEAAAARVMDVRGRLLPGTAAATRANWYSDRQITDVDLPAGLLPPGTAIPVVTVRADRNTVVNGTVLAPLDLSGELWHALRAAQAGYRGERARAWATTLEQQLAVVRAYYQLLEAIHLKRVAEQTVEVYGTQLAIAEDRYANGRLTKNDLLTFDVARKNARQEVLQRDLLIERARWDLNEAIGADVDRAIDPVDERAEPSLPPIDESLRLAWRHNPVLLSLVEEQQRLQETVTSLERSRLPRLNAGGAIDWQSQQILIPQAIGTGFVGFTWDVGTDLRRESQISAARIEAERNRVEIERQMRELEAAVRTAHLAAIERLEAYRTALSAVEQAEENLRIRRQQFDAGRAQSDDVLIAENLLSRQRATLATALYQAHVRRAELQRLIGLPIASE